MKRRFYDILVLLGLSAIIVGLFSFTEETVAAAKDGIRLCLEVIIPSLLPYFTVSGMIVAYGLAEKCGKLTERVTKRLFNVNGACSAAVLLGFIGGFPIGAKTAVSLYENGSCSSAEAERLTAFCNNSGPAFVIGVVGASVFGSAKVGIFLYAVQCVSAIIVGLVFRLWKSGDTCAPRRNPPAGRRDFASAFTGAVGSAVMSCINVSGFVILFSVLIKLAELCGMIDAAAHILSLFNIRPDGGACIVRGFLELTSGVWSMKGIVRGASGAVISSLLLGWSGLSVHAQTLSVISDSGLSAKPYFIGKALQAFLSAAITAIALRIIKLPVSAFAAEEAEAIKRLNIYSSIFTALCAAGGIAAFFVMMSRNKK